MPAEPCQPSSRGHAMHADRPLSPVVSDTSGVKVVLRQPACAIVHTLKRLALSAPIQAPLSEDNAGRRDLCNRPPGHSTLTGNGRHG